jgi:carbamate kinase
MRIVVAVGGNALIRAGQAGTWPEQLASAREMVTAVLALRGLGHEVVLTHGNGPHVGALLLQNMLGEAETTSLPLDALTAMTQGWIGYLLESSFAELDPSVPIAVLLTRVLVDREDAAFEAPTKPVGPFYDEPEARRWAGGWDVAPDANGWRRVVPPPASAGVLGEHVRALLTRARSWSRAAAAGSVAEQGDGGRHRGRDRQGPLLGGPPTSARTAGASHWRAARVARPRALGARVDADRRAEALQGDIGSPGHSMGRRSSPRGAS